ncbi:hypothetical protein [Marinicrinis sediminis]|uniref:Uncharacterized protein n=1 Tax=Marinicrinis sediminis TaxID=1652465 RepID=A0ABW5RA53_9BACL
MNRILEKSIMVEKKQAFFILLIFIAIIAGGGVAVFLGYFEGGGSRVLSIPVRTLAIEAES